MHNFMIVVMLIIIQTFMYTCTFVVGYSIAKLYILYLPEDLVMMISS